MKRKKKNNLPLEIVEKNKSKASMVLALATFALLCLILTQVDKTFVSAEEEAAVSQKKGKAKDKGEAKAQEATTTSARILVAGDNILGGSLLSVGQADEASWNYDQVYSLVKEQVSQADLAMVTQESAFLPDHSMVDGSTDYAAPQEVGAALANTGFSVIASATDHVDDFGAEYISSTLEFWRSNYPDIQVVGIHGSQEEADSICVVERNQIKIAILNYTFGSCTDSIRTDAPYMVDYLEKEKVANAIAQAKSVSDCIIFLAHWGDQDCAQPNEYQNQWAQFLMQQGVTVLVGTNPYVLQPYCMLSDLAGDEMLVYYSLGNFVSDAQSSPELLGGLAEFTLEKTSAGGEDSVKVTDNTLTPIVVHYTSDMSICNVYPLSSYTDSLAQGHGILAVDYYSNMQVSALQNLFNYIMSLQVTVSGESDLLDYTYNADSTLSREDGSILYPGEVDSANAEAGSLSTLLQVMSGEIASDTQATDSTGEEVPAE